MTKIYTYLEERFFLNESIFSAKSEDGFRNTSNRLTKYGKSVVEDFDEKKFANAANKIGKVSGFEGKKPGIINKHIGRKIAEVLKKQDVDKNQVTGAFEKAIRVFNMGALTVGLAILSPFIWIYAFLSMCKDMWKGDDNTSYKISPAVLGSKYMNLIKNLWITVKHRTPHTERYYKKMFLAIIGILITFVALKIFDHDGIDYWARGAIKSKIYAVVLFLLIYSIYAIFKFCSELSNLKLTVKKKPHEENPTEMEVGNDNG